MSRLIDAERLKRTFAACVPPVAQDYVSGFCAIVDHVSTVDAVEVVRCKDCRFYRPSQWEGDIACCINVQDGLISFPGESDYCSRCERKGEE